MNRRFLLLLGLCICQIGNAAESAYSMKDLRALADQGEWSELAAHLEDIRPADRNADWSKVMEQTAMGLLDEAGGANDSYSALSTRESLLMRFPKLKTNKAFMTKRADAGLNAFGVCFQNGYGADQCLQDLTKFVKNDAANLDLAFKAGKLARTNLKHWAAAPFFASALVEPSKDRRCDDEDVALAVMSGLGLPSTGYEPQYGASVKLALQLCWKELKGALTEQIASNGDYFRENTCDVFKAKNALEGEVANVCRKYQK
jgi:hypothetical protein